MNIRQPVRAGMFYEKAPSSLRHHAEKLLAAAEVPADLPRPLYGGIVPHAGWVYSGALAAGTLKALLGAPADRGGPQNAISGVLGPRARRTVVLLGADHTGMVRRGEVYDSGVWRTPLGDVEIDAELAQAVLAAGESCRSNPDAHAMEHSLEVQVPLLQVIASDLRILPIAVPPSDLAVPIGQAVAKAVGDRAAEVVIVGSTDLTHHGGHFPAPGGRGEVGERWTRANDRRMIDLIEAMDAEAIVPEAHQRMNACGAGAVAATVAACKALGAARGVLLAYTNSYAVVREKYPYELDDTTVGYASVVFA